MHEVLDGVVVLRNEVVAEHVGAVTEGPEERLVGEQRPDSAALEGGLAEDAPERPDVDLAFAQSLLGVDGGHHGELDLCDLLGCQPLLCEPFARQELMVCAESVHADLLADQVARGTDRAVFEHVVPGEARLVRAVGGQHSGQWGTSGLRFDDGTVERRPELDLVGRRVLQRLRSVAVVADPFELDVFVVAERFGQLGEADLCLRAFVPQDGLAVGGHGRIRARGARGSDGGECEKCCGCGNGGREASAQRGVRHRVEVSLCRPACAGAGFENAVAISATTFQRQHGQLRTTNSLPVR